MVENTQKEPEREPATQRYARDIRFHNVVDWVERLIVAGDFTAADVQDAVILAARLAEESKQERR